MQQPYRAAANLFGGAARGGAPGNVFADVAADIFAIHFMVHTDLMAGCHIGGLIPGDCADLEGLRSPRWPSRFLYPLVYSTSAWLH